MFSRSDSSFSVMQRLLLLLALHKSVITFIGTSVLLFVFFSVCFFRGGNDDNKVNKKQVYLKMQ